MDYLIRFAQTHEAFRKPEVEALSRLAGLRCQIESYAADSPFCGVRFPDLAVDDDTGPRMNAVGHDDAAVGAFVARSILSKSIYEVWGQGGDYEALNVDVRRQSQFRQRCERFRHAAFKFSVDSYGSTRDMDQQRTIIDSFRYLAFQGPIRMKNPDVEFAVLEEWLPLASPPSQDQSPPPTTTTTTTTPLPLPGSDAGLHTPIDRVSGTSLRRVLLCRKIGDSRRWLREKHDLKKRPYISTTSMDAELALVTATLALAAPGKIFLDPFVGTGGFMVAAAELGALVLGSDIDGRSYRGKGEGLENGVGANFRRYGLSRLFGDCMTSDLTNTPFRNAASNTGSLQDPRWLDGIVADPPYGVREGLKVLGTRVRASVVAAANTNGASSLSDDGSGPGSITEKLVNGVPAHTLPGFIAPKKPYSFARMLDDILDFAARTLVDGGRLAFWMPSANENEAGEDEPTAVPRHRHLELKHECVQRFNKWSRRLLVYERLPGAFVSDSVVADGTSDRGTTADELNPFRRRYFQSFETNGIS